MKDNELLELLEETAEKLSVSLEYDDLKKGEIDTHGGTFLLRGTRHILIHKHLTVAEKVDILTEILSPMCLETGARKIELAPELRKRLWPKGKPSSPSPETQDLPA
ncbi:MAG: hypothetical protein KAS88_03190 [Deltaproteobacteria bacterium]|nr:hypothetical protein [Deltaproteobacteria bacterium]